MAWRSKARSGMLSPTPPRIASVTIAWAWCFSGLMPGCARTDTHSRDVVPPEMPPETHSENAAALREQVPAKTTTRSPGAHAAVASGSPTHASSPGPCVVPSPAEAPAPVEPAANCPADPTGPPELAWGAIRFVDAPQSPRIRIELAESDETRARGLMYRTTLEQDQGMLFVFPDERPRSFWMKNTCIPLDMLFVDRDGAIVGILENVPTLNRASRGVPCPAAHVLEVNAGWTREHGVFAGQRLEIDR